MQEISTEIGLQRWICAHGLLSKVTSNNLYSDPQHLALGCIRSIRIIALLHCLPD